MSKRIAIQLFGHLRSFRITYKSLIKNIVESNKKDGYEVDIFIHTWAETDHSDVVWHNPSGKKRGAAVTENIKNEIYKFYKPKKILVEKQLEAKSDVKDGKRVLNLAYTVYKSSELRHEYQKETSVLYDYVIVTRPDILFYKPFRLNSFLSVYEKYNMEIPQNALFVPYYFGNEINNTNESIIYDKRFILNFDLLFWGDETVIDKATNIYSSLNLENIYSQLWYRYWVDEHLNPIRIKYDERMCFSIIRTRDYWGVGTIIIRFIRRIIKLVLPYGIVNMIKKI